MASNYNRPNRQASTLPFLSGLSWCKRVLAVMTWRDKLLGCGVSQQQLSRSPTTKIHESIGNPSSKPPQGDTKSWKDCSLKEWINIKIDLLAKKALVCAHAAGQYFNGQFPLDDFQIHTMVLRWQAKSNLPLKNIGVEQLPRSFLIKKVLFSWMNLTLSSGRVLGK